MATRNARAWKREKNNIYIFRVKLLSNNFSSAKSNFTLRSVNLVRVIRVAIQSHSLATLLTSHQCSRTYSVESTKLKYYAPCLCLRQTSIKQSSQFIESSQTLPLAFFAGEIKIICESWMDKYFFVFSFRPRIAFESHEFCTEVRRLLFHSIRNIYTGAFWMYGVCVWSVLATHSHRLLWIINNAHHVHFTKHCT